MKHTLLLAGILTLTLSGAFHARAGNELDPDVLRNAFGGNAKALHEVFRHSNQEQGGRTSAAYENALRQLLQTVGNARFTEALRSESPTVQRRVVFFLSSAFSSH